ncbi:MAG: M23 family metallopeptidase [Verrucomicrobiota bacterium]|nr:M23 family metallopeptidase [Verrucomicrobiota bacterium]
MTKVRIAATVEMNLKTSKGGARLGTIVAMLLAFCAALAAGIFLRLPTRVFESPRDAALRLPSPLDLASLPTAARFDFPLGSEHGAFAYNAQPFTQNRHLGDDLNGIGGENSDLGDPVYAVADGRVIFAREGGPGWGKIVILLHAYEENGTRKYVQSYYAHLQSFSVALLDEVKRGQQIATVGNADGKYWAHLHFEMREFLTPFVGAGYREDTRGWLNPSEFIAKHRGAAEDDIGR